MSVPDLNIMVNVWTGTSLPPNPKRTSYACNLQYAKRFDARMAVVESGSLAVMLLNLPPHSDVRSRCCTAVSDLVEVPAGSGRYYDVLAVDDVSKGFPEEYRIAVIIQSTTVALWPIPIP